MSAFPRIFIGDIYIFFSDYLGSILKSYSQMNIIEGNRDNTSFYVKHVSKGIDSTFKITSNINQCSKEDISNLISSDYS
jgi:hypothetical protein